MEKHRGEMVELAIRKSGYTITTISEKLGVSRNTLYNKFQKPNLNYDFIALVGQLIHYDFSNEFPVLKQISLDRSEKAGPQDNAHVGVLLRLEQQYFRLLEVYNKLLYTLVSISDDSKLAVLKEEIIQLIDEA